MTTNSVRDDYGYDESVYDNESTRPVPYENHSDVRPNDYNNGTRTSKNGTYNIVPKDYGDHKVNYYIPRGYDDENVVSQFEDMSIVEEQQQQQQQPIRGPSVARRPAYQQYDNYNNNTEVEYLGEAPVTAPRTVVHVAPARHRDTQIITEIYQPPRETIEYIYEAQPRPETEEVEYVIEERAPEPIYVEEPRSIRRRVIIQEPVMPPTPPPPTRRVIVVPRTPTPEPRRIVVVPRTPTPEPIETPRRTLIFRRTPTPEPRRVVVVPRTPTPEPIETSRRTLIFPRTPTPELIETPRRTIIIPRTPSPDPAKSSRRTLLFPKSSSLDSVKTNRRRTEVVHTFSRRQQPIIRSPPLPLPPPSPPVQAVKRNVPKFDEQPPSLKEIVAENRAQRGSHIRKPKREIYEDKVHDLPTYNKNIIKNGFIVHK